MLDVQVVDGSGTGQKITVTPRGEILISISSDQVPPIGSSSRKQYYNALLGSGGADTGTTNMNVNGSSTAQEFYISSELDHDIRVMQILIFISDATVLNKNFGDVSPLANGWTLKATESGQDTNIINAAKTTGAVIVQTNSPIFAPSAASQGNVLTEVDAASNQAAIILLNIGMLVPGGLRIGRDTRDRITSVVSDNLTGLANFLVRAFGYKHFP